MKNDEERLTADAYDKLTELLTCGNERVELAAAKELISMTQKDNGDDKDIKLEVTIKVI